MNAPRLSRDIVVYGLGEILVKAFGLVTLPIYTRIFSAAEYGTLSVVLTVAGFVLALVAVGGDSAFIRYFLATTDQRERRRITSTWIGFLGVWSAAAVAVLLPFADEISRAATGGPAAGGAMLVALLFTPIRLINMMCGQVLRNEFRAWSYTAFNVVALSLSVSASLVGAVILEMGVVGVLLGTLFAELVMLPGRLLSVRHMLSFELSLSDLRGLLAYGLPLVPTSVAYWVFTTSDRVLIGNLASLDQVGLYSVAASLVSISMIAVTGLGQAWNPHAVRAYERDPERAGRLFGRMFTHILAGFGGLAVGLTAFGPELVAIVAGDDFRRATPAIAPLAVGMVAYATTQVTAGGITMLKRTGYLAIYAWLAAGINVGLNLLLIPAYGMVGAAWATAAAYACLTGAYLVTSYRLWPFSYDWRRAGAVAGLVAGGLLLAIWMPSASDVPPPEAVGLIIAKTLLGVVLVGAFLRIGALGVSSRLSAAWKRGGDT